MSTEQASIPSADKKGNAPSGEDKTMEQASIPPDDKEGNAPSGEGNTTKARTTGVPDDTTQAEASGATVQQHATANFFNIGNVGYDISGITWTAKSMVTVRKWSTKVEHVSIPPINGTEAEKGNANGDEIPGLLVGVTFGNAKYYRSKQASKPAPDGLSIPETKQTRGALTKAESYFIIHQQQDAIRVVVPARATTQLQYYGLINADDEGLCSTIIVSQEDVFYAPEWRLDDTAAQEIRRSEMPMKIKRHLDTLDQAERAPSFRPAKTRPNIHVEAVVEELSELLLLLQIHSVDPENKQALDDAIAALTRYDQDLSNRIVDRRVRQLLNPNIPSDEVMVKGAVVELVARYPDLTDPSRGYLTEGTISALAAALRDPNAPVVPYGHVRSVVLGFCRAASHSSDGLIGDEKVAERQAMLASALGEALFHIGQAPTSASVNVPEESFCKCLAAIAKYLRVLEQRRRQRTRASMDAAGGQIFADNVEQIWATYGDSPDVDSARVYGAHLYRHALRETSVADGASGADMERLAGHIERMLLSFDAEEDAPKKKEEED